MATRSCPHKLFVWARWVYRSMPTEICGVAMFWFSWSCLMYASRPLAPTSTSISPKPMVVRVCPIHIADAILKECLWFSAVPMTVVSDKGSETGKMIEFQTQLRYGFRHIQDDSIYPYYHLFPGEMLRQRYLKMNSNLGSRSKASITHLLKGSGCGSVRGKGIIFGM